MRARLGLPCTEASRRLVIAGSKPGSFMQNCHGWCLLWSLGDCQFPGAGGVGAFHSLVPLTGAATAESCRTRMRSRSQAAAWHGWRELKIEVALCLA